MKSFIETYESEETKQLKDENLLLRVTLAHVYNVINPINSKIENEDIRILIRMVLNDVQQVLKG